MKKTCSKPGCFSILRRKILEIIGFQLIMIAMISCDSIKVPDGKQLEVEWEIVSSVCKETPAVKAYFKFTNSSTFTLTHSNWEFYFNQSPRTLFTSDSLSGMVVERLSGDFYRIKPLKGFELKPGEQVILHYESDHWWIKESDAPMGCYWVFLDEKGNEHIVEALSVTILPFERDEQLMRHKADMEELPTARSRFQANQSIVALENHANLPIVPTPAKIKRSDIKASFKFPLTIYYGVELENEFLYLQSTLKAIFGQDVIIKTEERKSAQIELLVSEELKKSNKPESYSLSVNENQLIVIKGADAAGVFYGIQSLIALLPVESLLEKQSAFSLPVLEIEDAPRFGYRGVHVDVVRNFQTKESLFKIIDILAFYKINVLHLHITDDEGWRLEIPALPELTTVGAQRGHASVGANALHPAYGSGPFAYAKGKHGSGFYTRNDYVEILRYAKSRHIKVVPEINLPGHARAAIKSMESRYEHFMKQGNVQEAEKYRLIDPEEKSVYVSAQFFHDNVINVARESVYTFFETVLDAIIEMYEEAGAELEILHGGGDEVPRGAWSDSPMVRELISKLDNPILKNNMHAYYMHRVMEIVRRKGIKMGGWEEIALVNDEKGKHVPNKMLAGDDVIPYVWNNLWGSQDLAYRLANAGYPVVLCHVTNFYFDLAYNKDPLESGLYWAGFVNTRSAWHYNPYDVFKTTLKDNMGRNINPEVEYKNMERLRPENRNKILGVQAQLWSETILGAEMLEYYLLPKLIGFSESAWASERIWETSPNPMLRATQVEEGWNAFANAIGHRELPRLSVLFGGYNYRIPMPGAIIEDGMLKANIEFPGLIIRYTLDGSEPDAHSAEFTAPIKVGEARVKLRAFDKSGRASRIVTDVR